MPDSLQVVDIQTGIALFDQLLPQIAAMILIPTLTLIGKTKLSNWFPIPVWAGWLSIAATFVIAHFWAPDTTIVQIFQIAAATTGSSLFTHSLATWGVGKVKPVVTVLMNCFRT